MADFNLLRKTWIGKKPLYVYKNSEKPFESDIFWYTFSHIYYKCITNKCCSQNMAPASLSLNFQTEKFLECWKSQQLFFTQQADLKDLSAISSNCLASSALKSGLYNVFQRSNLWRFQARSYLKFRSIYEWNIAYKYAPLIQTKAITKLSHFQLLYNTSTFAIQYFPQSPSLCFSL